MSTLYRRIIPAVLACIMLIIMLVALPVGAALPIAGQNQTHSSSISQTAQPTLVPRPPLPNAPTPILSPSGFPIGTAPLTIRQSVESDITHPGQQVLVTLNVSSAIGGSVTVTSQLQGPAIVTASSATGGTCHSETCSFYIAARQTIVMTLYLHIADGSSGQTVTIQSLVQDEWNYTAASDQNQLSIIAAHTPPTNIAPGSAAPQPAPAPAPPALAAPQPEAAPAVSEFQQKSQDQPDVSAPPEEQAQPEPPSPPQDISPQAPTGRERKQRG